MNDKLTITSKVQTSKQLKGIVKIHVLQNVAKVSMFILVMSEL